MVKKDFKLSIYQSPCTVFTINEIALLLRDTNRNALKSRVNYYVGKEALIPLTRGIYGKPGYDKMELATKIYRPSYISMETVLRENDVIFQYDNTITAVSYLSRVIEVSGNRIIYRKIKDGHLLNPAGIVTDGIYPKATKERAFIDTLYLYRHFHFDRPEALDKNKIFELMQNMKDKKLASLVKNFFKNA